nr:transposase [uncultured Clostridium sp.]
MKEQISILTQNRFGRRSEKTLPTEGQLSFHLENLCILDDPYLPILSWPST